MASGVLLLVDAFEGPMPQTRFVLQKAIALDLKPIVVINKVDKPNCDPEAVHESVFDLMYHLEASEEQLDFPVVYGSSKDGWMSADWQKPKSDISYLLDTILEHIPKEEFVPGTPQLQISSLDYSSYTGRIAVGKLSRGSIKWGMDVSLIKHDGKILKSRIKELYVFEGLAKEKIKTEVSAGEICAILGLEDFDIGDTVADLEEPEGLKPMEIDEPTMSMLFTINNSPFYGREGKFVTSRQIRERLFKETEKNLALRVEETESPEIFIVYGRGILHLSILVETMRREGYELQLGQPKVIIKKIDGKDHEPIESMTVHVPEEFSGKVIELVTQRKGDILHIDTKGDRSHLEFDIPSRGIIGLRNLMLTATEGEAIMAHRFKEFQLWKGEIQGRRNGSLISMETGTAIAYSINKLQDRGTFFVYPKEEIYEGQVVGEHIRQNDITVNLTKTKKLSNIRAAGSDDKIFITPAVIFSLEESMEYIGEDEYLEVTPRSLRLRKIFLKEHERKKTAKAG
jgi:GTP-binding protein